jgi:uncharacterized delta-60 repeat protein
MPNPSTPRAGLLGIKFAGLALMVTTGMALRAQVAPSPGDGFNPNANGIVNTVILQPDSKILMGGYFTQLKPDGKPLSNCGYLARLNHDGSVDASFSPVANGVVRPMLLQPNGQIIIGGQFTTIQPTGSGTPQVRNYAARLNADGTLDSVFNPNTNGVVYALAYQPNGQIIIGGSFTTVQPAGSAPVTRNHIARFNADGTLDTTFDPNTDRPVLSIAVQSSGQILVGGGFSTFSPNGSTTSTVRNCLARLNSNGSLDTTFDPEANGSVSVLYILPDGRFLAGGQFTSMQPDGVLSPIGVDFLARFSASGTLDTSYFVDPLGSISSVAPQPDGKLVISGNFTRILGVNATSTSFNSYIARVNPDGSLDSSFNPGPNGAVNSVAVQPDGDVIMGGYFTTLSSTGFPNPIVRNYIARVETTGAADFTFAPNNEGTIFASVPLPNGQILVGGSFLSIGGVTQAYIARLNADGSLDRSFAPTFNNSVQTIALQSNGQYLVGGHFTTVDGLPRNYVVRLNANGTFDGPFNPNPDSPVTMLAVLSNGQILMGGLFSDVVPNGATVATTVGSLIRLNSDGTLDTTYNPEVSGGAIYAASVLSDGRVVIAGEFTSVGGVNQSYVARLSSKGSYDTTETFNPQPNRPVYALAVQSNGQVIIGGSFSQVQPITGKAPSTATLPTVTLPNGTVQTYPPVGLSSNYPIYVNNLARLNADGSLDTTFFPDPNLTVLSLGLQSNGSIIVGGNFTSFAPNGATSGTLVSNLARIGTTGAVDTTFNPNPNGQVDTVNMLSSGQIFVGGSFTAVQPNGAATPTPAVHFALINTDGTASSSFTTGTNTAPSGQVNAIALEQTGQLIVGGSFSPFDGAPGSYLARIDPDGTANIGFAPNPNGPVNAVAIEPDAGSNTLATDGSVWLNASGSVRYRFTEAAGGTVSAVAQQANGQILIGGVFSNFAGNDALVDLVRVNTDGTVDATFVPNVAGQVNAILPLANGQIIVAGSFTEVGVTPNSAGSTLATALVKGDTYVIATLGNTDFTTVGASSNTEGTVFIATGPGTGTGTVNSGVAGTSYLVRLNSDGTLDKAFSPAVNGLVDCLALQSNGDILIGGQFTQVNVPVGATTGTGRSDIARLNPDGTVDTTFNPDINGQVFALAVLPSGQIMVGGGFSTITPNAGSTAYNEANLVRLNSDGTVDTNFYPDPDEAVQCMVVQPNGQVVVGGSFQSFTLGGTVNVTTPATPVGVDYLARINTDGSVDTSFEPEPSNPVLSLALLPNGQFIVGGNFSQFDPNFGAQAVARFFSARLNSNGTVDTSFDVQLNDGVTTIAILADGSLFFGGSFSIVENGPLLLAGGSFSAVSGDPVANLTRLNSDGTVDTSFTANADGTVNAITFESSGVALVGGSFAHVGGQARANLAELNSDGTLNATFNPGASGPVNAFALQANGQIVVGGSFTSVGGVASPNLARLGASGAADSTFLPAVNGAVDAVVAAANGQIIIGGSFTNVGGTPVGNIARINSNGTVDATFNPNANGTVESLSLEVDGTILATGSFTSIGGLSVPYAARLEPNGAVDTTFAPAPNGVVSSATVAADGKIILGGAFTSAGGYPRYEIARFANTDPVTETIGASADLSTLTWTQGGGAPSLGGVVFEESTDDVNWTVVGQGKNISQSSWQISGLLAPASTPFFVRVSGILPTSGFSSSGLMQQVGEITPGVSPVVDSVAQATGSSGSPFSFTVTATQAGTSFTALGLPPGLTINSSTGVISGTPTAAGTYEVSLIASGSGGSSTSTLVITVGSTGSTFITSGSISDRLANLSCRDQLAGNQTLIAGFSISGTNPETVLLRAVGPGLTQFNVAGAMATPELQLYSSSGALLLQNSAWGGSSTLSTAFAQVGAFALSPASADAGAEATLAPGSYTLHVFDASGVGGTVLMEIYDVNPSPLADATELINISARGTVSPGAGALIGGFVISGPSSETVLVRGVGPGLASFGVANALVDPVLNVYDANGTLVASNRSWSVQVAAGPYQQGVTAAALTSADSAAGAFALSAGSADTAIIATLPPGPYTFEVTSASNSTGQALGEVYLLP